MGSPQELAVHSPSVAIRIEPGKTKHKARWRSSTYSLRHPKQPKARRPGGQKARALRVGQYEERRHALVHHGSHHSVPADVGLVEEGVEVGQQRVADVQVVLGGPHQEGVGSVICRILGLKGGGKKDGMRGRERDRRVASLGVWALSVPALNPGSHCLCGLFVPRGGSVITAGPGKRSSLIHLI